MQVKKFEAKSMKEALEMVKANLGPEAIILSAKDSRSGFGLAGQQSVQVTAAVSQEMLQKKRLAEKKLNELNHSRYTQSPASRQKDFIEKVHAQHKRQQEVKTKTFTSTPYIDIEDDRMDNSEFISHQPVESADSVVENVEERIQGAAARAFKGAADFLEDEAPSPKLEAPKSILPKPSYRQDSEVSVLKKEIKRLQKLVTDFQQVPQSFTSLHPGADDGIPYELSFMYEKLSRAGLDKDITVSLLRELEESLPADKLKKKAYVSAWVAKYLLNNTEIASNRTSNKYHVFVGPSGNGKTASLVKLASHLVICEKKRVAIVTTDNRKVGGSEQLKIYAQILNVPFAIIRRKQDWQILDQKLANVDCILVDSPGMNLKSMGEVDFLRDILPPSTGGRSIHYVQSALARDESAIEIANRYKTVGFDDFIFTNIDETTHHGIIFNFQKKFSSPLHSFGIGAHIPEDFEPATKERVVDLIFKISNLKKNEGSNE